MDRVGFGPEGVVIWVNGQPVSYNEIRSIGWPSDEGAVIDSAPTDIIPEDGSVGTPTFEPGDF